MKTIEKYQNFLEISQLSLSVIIAKTKTCNVCVPITKKVEQLMREYPNIPLFQIYLENVLEFQGQQLIFAVPTIVIFSEGKEILRESRFVNFDNIERLLKIYSE
ncbi:MAG: thioredoxin family protein [Acholeplasmataceae bacterium]